MRPLIAGMTAAAFLLVLSGCDRKGAVSTDLSRAEFIQGVEERLADLDSRINRVKSEAGDRGDVPEAVIETTTEMAEERIETIRKTLLPALSQAADEGDVELFMGDVNQMLVAATAEVERAEKALTDAMSDREQFVEQVSDELDTLKRRLADTRAKAADVGDTVEIRVHAAGESVEEAIQEAHKALDRYKDAAETDAVALRDNIDHLLASARTTLEQIARMIDEAAEQATAT